MNSSSFIGSTGTLVAESRTKWARQIDNWDREKQDEEQKFNVVRAHFDATVLKRQQGGQGETTERLEFELFEGAKVDEIP